MNWSWKRVIYLMRCDDFRYLDGVEINADLRIRGDKNRNIKTWCTADIESNISNVSSVDPSSERNPNLLWPTAETLVFAFYIDSTPTFYISISRRFVSQHCLRIAPHCVYVTIGVKCAIDIFAHNFIRTKVKFAMYLSTCFYFEFL